MSQTNLTNPLISNRRLWPFVLIVVGLFLLIGGFIYDVMFAGIPYQDPTPEMSARYARHAFVASTIRWCGLGVFLFGALAKFIRWLGQRAGHSVVA